MTSKDPPLDRKQAAVQFLQMVVAGRIEDAYRKYVDMKGKHHNPFFSAGFQALKDAMMENHGQSPNKKITARNVIGDGNLVAVHSHLLLGPGQKSMTVVHIFRFEGDRVAEMWDCGQILPDDSPNADGAF